MSIQVYAHCADTCRGCISACQSVLDLVNTVTAPDDSAHCVDLCRSAIRLCGLVIEELELRSVFSIQVCALCALICRACAEECETRDGPVWRACATACLRAAAECHAIATLPRGAGTGRVVGRAAGVR